MKDLNINYLALVRTLNAFIKTGKLLNQFNQNITNDVSFNKDQFMTDMLSAVSSLNMIAYDKLNEKELIENFDSDTLEKILSTIEDVTIITENLNNEIHIAKRNKDRGIAVSEDDDTINDIGC